MRLILAALVAALASVPPADAARTRGMAAITSRCHCDRYLNPRYTERASPAWRRSAYRGADTYRRY